MKTAASVTLDYESDDKGKGYSLTCHVDDIIRKDSSVLSGPHASFYRKPTIECSNSIITSLPFQFVKNLQVGKPQNLPKAWKTMVKKDAERAYKSVMTSIQLWRHRSCVGHKGKIYHEKIYRAELETQHKGKISTTTAFIKEKDATRHILSEPWIVEQASSLCSTRNYREIVFGEGAKSSTGESVGGTSPFDSHEYCENFWYSKENHTKLCTEGAIANMFFHLGMKEEAQEFRNLAVLSAKQLLEVLQQPVVPKRVINNHHRMDSLEKCMWILEKKYNCRRFRYLNTDQFKTSSKVVENMSAIKLPVLISVCGHDSVYNHVVVVWRGIIIDFETSSPYALTVSNVENICGPKNAFHRIRCGLIILPSKKMKGAIKDFTDWGEHHLRVNFSHLLWSRNV